MSAPALAELLLRSCHQLSCLATQRLALHMARSMERLSPAEELAGLEEALRDVVEGLGCDAAATGEAAAVLRTAEVLIDERVLEQDPVELTEPVTDLAEQLVELFQQLCCVIAAHQEAAVDQEGALPPIEVVYGRVRRQLVPALAELERAWPPEALEGACERLREVTAAVDARLLRVI
jgi:hypothetical protein